MRLRLFPRLAAVIMVFLAVTTVTAQKVDDFTYTHLGLANGLCSQRIYSIRQTADGALWWSNKDGVERFNGVSVKHYHLGKPSFYSYYAGRKTQLTEAADGSLMAFDNKGSIFTYDAPRDSFLLYADLTELFSSDVILNYMLPVAEGLWLAMREGIWFLHGQTLTPVVRNVYSSTIIKTRYGLLLCTKEGVKFYNADINGVPAEDMQLPTQLGCQVESGYYDATYNKVWLGGFLKGLRIYTPNANGTLTDGELVGDAIRNPVRSICPYDEHTMLVGIDGMGVYKVTRQPAAGNHYEATLLFDANDGPEGVLHGNGVYSVVRDSWGNIVIGSYSGGIDVARPVGSTPAIFQHVRNNHQSLLNDHVNCVAQFPNGILVMGTDNGVSLHTPATRQWTHTCQGAVVLSLCLTPQGTMLAATYGKGVYEITENGQARELYAENNGVLKDDHVYKVFYDREGNLWMGCLDGDLVQKTADGCRYYDIKNVQDIAQLPDGRIAVGTANGIWLITPATGQLTELNYKGDFTDVNKFVHTLFVNDGKKLWIGTDGGGVYVFDLQASKTLQLSKADGLPSNAVSSICRDNKGRILIATDEGLAFVMPEAPKNVYCVNYCYGIEREYAARAVATMHNGHILYGTTSGALIINPDNIEEINYTANLNILGIDGDELNMDYDERTFDLHYECINLRNQYDIVYQYKVGDGQWSQPDDQQYIRFTNLEPGCHELLLRSVSRTCGTVLDEERLCINIAQPWWNSWWMWVVYAGLILLAFYGAWRVYQLHTKYMRLVVEQVEIGKRRAERTEEETAHKEENDEDRPKKEPEEEEPTDDIQEDAAFIDKATRLVVENLHDTDFTIDRLCREMAMSRTLFYLKLKTYTGKSPQDFIRIIRLERAASLLRGGRSVMETATLAGFDNPKYFSTVFKKYFGVSPSKY